MELSRNELKRRARAYEKYLRADAVAKANEGRPLHALVRTPKRNLGKPLMDVLADRRLRQRHAVWA